jgi:hypothetical protein
MNESETPTPRVDAEMRAGGKYIHQVARRLECELTIERDGKEIAETAYLAMRLNKERLQLELAAMTDERDALIEKQKGNK